MPQNPTAARVYATRAELAKYGLPAATLADIDVEAQDAALAAASGEADTYLAAAFALPLDAWSPVLTQQVCAIAAWHLLTSVGFNPAGAPDRAVRERCEDARRWLAQIAAQRGELAATGTAVLGPSIVGRALRGWRRR